MEELRDAWFDAPDAAARRSRPTRCRSSAFEFVPFIPTAQFVMPTAYRTNISGVIIAPITFLWNVEKK